MNVIKPYHVIETDIDTEKVMKHLEKCGRTCYKSQDLIKDESADKFIKAIVKSGHESVIEHYSITIRFVTSRAVTHQLVRHRLCSFSQESQRYINYSKEKFGNEITFIKPSWVTDTVLGNRKIEWLGVYGSSFAFENEMPKATNRWMWNCAICEIDYFRLLKEGWTPEQAREVLPNSAKTEIVVTANLREWRAIFKQRCDSHAQSEIRHLMNDTLTELKAKLPAIFEDLEFEV